MSTECLSPESMNKQDSWNDATERWELELTQTFKWGGKYKREKRSGQMKIQEIVVSHGKIFFKGGGVYIEICWEIK